MHALPKSFPVFFFFLVFTLLFHVLFDFSRLALELLSCSHSLLCWTISFTSLSHLCHISGHRCHLSTDGSHMDSCIPDQSSEPQPYMFNYLLGYLFLDISEIYPAQHAKNGTQDSLSPS